MKIYNVLKNIIKKLDKNLQEAKDYTDARGDYIVEEGYANNWHYCKWKSGIAECWQYANLGSIAFNGTGQKYGNGYYWASAAWYFPTNIFNAMPVVNGNVFRGGGLCGISFNYVDETQMRFYVYDLNADAADTTYVLFNVKGFWKTFEQVGGGNS